MFATPILTMNRKLIVLLLSLSSLAMSASQAAVILVEDQSTFLSLISEPILENFSTAIQGSTVVTSVGTFTAHLVYLPGFGLGDGSRFAEFDGSGTAPAVLTLLPGYSAAGSQIFWQTNAGLIASIIVTDSNNATYTFTNLTVPGATGAPSTKFIGFIADGGTTIKSVNYGISHTLCVDNYVIATAVPEPSTVAALAFGGIALSLLRLRRRKS